MIADVETGKVKRVIVKDMSRLGRDYLQVCMYTEIFFPEHDVHFIAVNDGVDSNQEDNEFTPFRNIINEWYAKDTSKKIRAVKRSKGMAGEHIGSHPPYGYMKNPENKKEWIIDEEAAEVVREIFRLCVGGYGPTQIANILTERKILCPTYYALEKGGKPRTALPAHKYAWNSPVVAMILERVDYLGHTVNFKLITSLTSAIRKSGILLTSGKYLKAPMRRLLTKKLLRSSRKYGLANGVLPGWEKCRCSPDCSTVQTADVSCPSIAGQMTRRKTQLSLRELS